jgi:hypothetical protein
MTLPIFSQTGATQFGDFNYPLGLLAFDLSASGRDGFERISRGERFNAADGDEDALTRLAYEMMSLFHEMRHFIDMFGTAAGCALFGGYVARLKEFAEISATMREAGIRWKFPLVKWSGENDCPLAVRKFIRQARAFSVGVDLFISPFNPVEIEGHCEDLLVELDYERGGKADAFPLRIGLIKGDEETLRTMLFPIGLEALTEANAHALSRNLVGHYFPPSIAERLEQRSTTFDREDQATTDEIAKHMAMLYMAVDLMITRFLKGQGIFGYPRDLIFAVVDRVLSTAKIALIEVQPGTTALHCDRVGSMLLDVLESEDPELLKAGTISDKSVLTSAYKSLIASLESGGDWKSVQDDRSPLSSVKIWESYVAKNFMLPLLRERVATNGRVFAKHNEFLGLINRIGLPPVRVVNGKLVFGNMPERVQQAWVHQLMLGQILNDMVKKEEISCPRAYSIFPGIDAVNFAFEGDCDEHMVMGCGTFLPGQAATTTPNCLFEHALRMSSLER